MRAPTVEEPSYPAGNRNLVSGGHTARPYEETGGGSVGAACMAARTAPPRRIHLRPCPGPSLAGPAGKKMRDTANRVPRRLSKNLAEDVCDRAAGNVCKGLRPLKVNCPKGKRSWPGPCAFNQHVFSNFFKSLKIRTAWRKDFFATLCGTRQIVSRGVFQDGGENQGAEARSSPPAGCSRSCSMVSSSVLHVSSSLSRRYS